LTGGVPSYHDDEDDGVFLWTLSVPANSNDICIVLISYVYLQKLFTSKANLRLSIKLLKVSSDSIASLESVMHAHSRKGIGIMSYEDERVKQTSLLGIFMMMSFRVSLLFLSLRDRARW